MPKKRKLKRVKKSDRTKILAEMKSKGLMAEKAAKKVGQGWVLHALSEKFEVVEHQDLRAWAQVLVDFLNEKVLTLISGDERRAARQ